MAIATVNARYEGFIFDGENSRNYGVYVTDVEVFGTPVRNVEMIQIPGRNGSYALDHGNFENIEVTYHCAIGADSQSDFNDAISDLRNMLASRIGYKRLEDEINTSEYRMAVYKGGLDVPTLNKETGTFDVVFDCKPQRWLKSGETAVDVSSTITNPTPFEAAPLFTVEGYGDITINGKTITVSAVPTGNILLANKTSITAQWATGLHALVKVAELTFDPALLNTNDDIILDGTFFAYDFALLNPLSDTITSVTISNQTGTGSTSGTKTTGTTATLATTIQAQAFKKGTPKTVSHSYMYDIAWGGGSSVSATNTVEIRYDGSGTFELWASRERTDNTTQYIANGSFGALNADSTVLVSGNIYIDLDIGEAYWNNGEYVSADFAVSIGADIPKLVPGTNTLSKSNTFTTCKITPRWWIV